VTPDSAGTATAFLCGEKAREGVIGVSQDVVYGDCTTVDEDAELESILRTAQKDGGESINQSINQSINLKIIVLHRFVDWFGYNDSNYARDASVGICALGPQILGERQRDSRRPKRSVPWN
jgi:hypothetical protein